MLDVLEPFKVRDSHTTSIAQDIWKEAHSFLQENLLALSGSGSVGSLNDKLTVEFVRIVGVDGLLEGSRNEDIAIL